jgi:hypothetical protein
MVKTVVNVDKCWENEVRITSLALPNSAVSNQGTVGGQLSISTFIHCTCSNFFKTHTSITAIIDKLFSHPTSTVKPTNYSFN